MSLALTDYDIGQQLTEFKGDKMQQHIQGIAADRRLCIRDPARRPTSSFLQAPNV
jgi:hypothetical protein